MPAPADVPTLPAAAPRAGPDVAGGGSHAPRGAPAAALLLADGRFPTGGHAHSGGIEAAVSAGRVTGVDELGTFLLGRLWTVGLSDAALAAATAVRAISGDAVDWLRLDAEAAARTPSAALRGASRQLGRHLLRAASRAWPDPRLDAVTAVLPAGPLHPVALGAAAAAAGLSGRDAAVVCAHGSVTTPATAAVRLLGLDPYEVSAILAGLSGDVDRVAARAAAASGELADLPAATAPLLDVTAEEHARWDTRLFAS